MSKSFLKLGFSALVLISVVYSAPRYRYGDPAGTGTISQGTSWATAFNGDTLFKFLVDSGNAEDQLFLKTGTYTLSGAYDFSAKSGTAANPIFMCGVKSVTTNEPPVSTDFVSDSVNRPIINGQTYQITTGNYFTVYSLYFKSSATYAIVFGTFARAYNCMFENTYGSTSNSYRAASFGSYGMMILSDVTSPNCRGIMHAISFRSIACRFFNIKYEALLASDAYNTIVGNKFSNCVIGISLGANGYRSTAFDNTFRKCGTSYSYEGTAAGIACINNIADSSTTAGFVSTNTLNSNLYLSNHGDDARNVNMWSNISETGPFADFLVTTGDPKFVNIASDSLQLGATSPCINTGIGAR